MGNKMVSPKAEFLNALSHHKILNSVPIWELEFHLWDKFGLGELKVGVEFSKLTKAEKEKALFTNVDTVEKVCDFLHFSAITIPGGYWEVSPGEPAFLWLPEEYRIRQATLLKDRLGDKIALVANAGGIMAMPEGNDYVDFSVLMMTDPDEIDLIANKKFQDGVDMIHRFSDLGMDVILTASDIADSHSLYFDSEQLERYVYPYLANWAELIRSKNMHSIMHTDGNINNALQRLVDCKIDGLQAIDSTANMDILQIQQAYSSQLCVCGNVDCGLIITGTPDEVYEATRNLLVATKSYGSFALGASNALEYKTPVENYLALVEAWRDFGRI